MILIIKDKDGVIERAVQLAPRDMVEFENDIHGGVKAKVNKWSWPIYGTVVITTDTGVHLGYQSYKDLVNHASVKIKKQICLKAYGKSVVAPNGLPHCVWASLGHFEPSVADARALTDEQLLCDAEPVIIVPDGNRGVGFTTVSANERFNNKNPLELTGNHRSVVSLWCLTEWHQNDGKSITEFVSVNPIVNPSIRDLLGSPIPNFAEAIKQLRADILHGTRELIHEVCEETLKAL